MTIVWRMRLGYGVILVLLVCVATLGAYALLSLRSDYQTFRRTDYPMLLAAQEMGGLASAQDAAVGMMLSDPENKAGYLEQVRSYGDRMETITEAALAVEGLDGDRVHAGDLEAILATEVQYLAMIEDVASKAGLMDLDAVSKFLSEARPLSDEIRAATATYLAAEKNHSEEELSSIDARAGVQLGVMLAASFLAAFAGVAFAVSVPRRISRQLEGAVSSLSSSAAEMMAIAAQVAAGAAQTAAGTRETTVTVEEVKQTALLSTETAGQVSDRAQEMSSIAAQGRQAVEDTIVGIEHMQARWALMVETVGRLAEQAGAVGDIITTVSDLAEQSNLLSVNASIEAAKAGADGKGFTVVAQEVKSLAEQSKQAVAQVRTILSEVQRASSVAVAAANKGVRAMEVGMKQSLETGEAIQLLAESVTEAASSAAQIAASSRQQLAGVEQISQAIESIDQAGGQTTASIRQVEQEVCRLQELASGLRGLVEQVSREDRAVGALA